MSEPSHKAAARIHEQWAANKARETANPDGHDRNATLRTSRSLPPPTPVQGAD